MLSFVFISYAPAVWFLLAIGCALFEILSPLFGFILIAAAALLTSGLALLCNFWGLNTEYSLLIQVISFFIILFLLFYFLRPWLLNRLTAPKQNLVSRADRLVGLHGRVIRAIDPLGKGGRVEVGGEDWAAYSKDPLQKGEEVVVKNTDGIVLQVSRVVN